MNLKGKIRIIYEIMSTVLMIVLVIIFIVTNIRTDRTISKYKNGQYFEYKGNNEIEYHPAKSYSFSVEPDGTLSFTPVDESE